MYFDNKVRQPYNLQSQQVLQEEVDLLDNPSDSVDHFFNFGVFGSQNIRLMPQDEELSMIECQTEEKNTSMSIQIQQKPCELIKGKNKLQTIKPQDKPRIEGHDRPYRSQRNTSKNHLKTVSAANKGQDKLTKICLKEIEREDTVDDKNSLSVHYDADVIVIKKKIKDKKEKLQVRLLFYFEDAALKFKYESELISLIETKIKIIEYEGVFQEFSKFKENLRQNLKVCKILNKDKQYIIQFIMMIVKYVIYKKYEELKKATPIQLDIIIDIKRALLIDIYDEPLKYIFLLLINKPEHKEIQWKGVIQSLKYQLEVSRSFYKSHQCAYANHVKLNKLSGKIIDDIWYNLNPPGRQSGAGKGHFNQLMQRIPKSDIKNFTINHYYSMLSNNKQRADVALYLDDLFNIIIQFDEL